MITNIKIVSQPEWDLFLQTGKITEARAERLAQKIQSNTEFSDRETAMYIENSVRIESILRGNE